MARNTLEIFGAIILNRNLAGLEKRKDGRVVNDEGNRNFNVILDPIQSEMYWNGERVTNPDFGQELAKLGFNVKLQPGRNEEEPTKYKLPVSVSFKSQYQPEIYIRANGKNRLCDEDTIAELDRVDLKNVDIVINSGKPYINNKTGQEMLKAWCNKGYFTIIPSRIDSRYAEEEANEE